MVVTNRLNLPNQVLDFANIQTKLEPNEYRVTSLLKGVKEIILEKRHQDEITVDVADMAYKLFGTAVHLLLENKQLSEGQQKEQRIKINVGNYILSGQFDLYDSLKGLVVDYKTTVCSKFIRGDFEDYRKQLLIYGYMLRSLGFPVYRGEVILFLKDFSKSKKSFIKKYPEHPIQKVEFLFSNNDFSFIERFIFNRFKDIEIYSAMPDDLIPECGLQNRFNEGLRFAVKKAKNKAAVKTFGTRTEAARFIREGKGDYIEPVEGIDRKCLDYCLVSDFCSFGLNSKFKQQIKKRKGGVDEDIKRDKDP